ncbi:MAG: hypothetical protein GPJ08_01360 [Microcystis aeruginosa G13-09]|nr:hypothetical protein [Microcystis aeruginosa G13-09]
MVINLNIPPSQPSANLKVKILIETLKNGQYVVSIAELPHFRVQAPTKEEAISQLQTTFIEQISQIETISWTTPLDNPSPNWREFAGIFENDADFQEIMDTLQAERTLDDDSEVDPSYYL